MNKTSDMNKIVKIGMNKTLKTFLIFLSVTIISYKFEAQGAEKKNDLGEIFNPDIFSLSKKKENAFDAPSATYVLSSEEIRRSGATSIPEALRLVPGVQVARIDGNSWAIAIRGFDRQFSNKLLVMIDGRIIYTYLFSGVFWNNPDYVLEDIDRIEVVRGPGGTIWGANAVNGIINIITKGAVQTQGAYFSQILGDQDKSITEVRYGGKSATEDSYRIYAKKSVRDALNRYDTKTSNVDGERQDRAGFRYDISSIKGNMIALHGDIYRGSADHYFATVANSQRENIFNGGNLMMEWSNKLSSRSNTSLVAYYDYDKMNTPILRRSASTIDVDFQHFYSFSKDNQFIWGLGYRQIIDDAKAYDVSSSVSAPLLYWPGSRNDQTYSAFIQDKFGLIPDRLYFTLGSKFLINDFTGFEYQPSARLAYYPSRNQTAWASISRAVRTPTRTEDGSTIRQGSGSNIVMYKGSNIYDSEELLAYELGYRIKPTSKTVMDFTAFYNDYSKLRTFEPDGNGDPIASNLGFGETYGFEVIGKWQVDKDWRLEASYEFLKLDLHISDNSNDDISRIGLVDSLQVAEGMAPNNQIKLKSFYNITPKIEFDNILYYVDDLTKAGTTYKSKGIPSYIRFDTRLGYLPTRRLDLSVGVQNLFDQVHREFKAGLYNRQTEVGRTFYFKMVWQY